jgi:hypothetical protein
VCSSDLRPQLTIRPLMQPVPEHLQAV